MKLQDPRRDVDPHTTSWFDVIFWVLWIIAMLLTILLCCGVLFNAVVNGPIQ